MPMKIGDVEVTVEPRNAALAVDKLKYAPNEIKREVAEHIERFANELATDAAARIVRHPSNLWVKAGRARYLVKKKSLLSYSVQSPGGEVGKAEFITESMQGYKTPQGFRLFWVLTRYYHRPGGRGKGRVLWATYDDKAPTQVKEIQRVIDDAAARLTSEVNRVG